MASPYVLKTASVIAQQSEYYVAVNESPCVPVFWEGYCSFDSWSKYSCVLQTARTFPRAMSWLGPLCAADVPPKQIGSPFQKHGRWVCLRVKRMLPRFIAEFACPHVKHQPHLANRYGKKIVFQPTPSSYGDFKAPLTRPARPTFLILSSYVRMSLAQPFVTLGDWHGVNINRLPPSLGTNFILPSG